MYIGIDILGFPLYITHQKEDYEVAMTYRQSTAGPQGASRFFNPYSKK